MKKYYIKNNLVTLRGNSYVLDEKGNKVYEVKGKLISLTHKKRLYNMEGKKLFTIRDKFWHFILDSVYIYNAEGKKVLKMKQRFFKSGFSFPINTYDFECESVFLEGIHIKHNGVDVGLFRSEGTFTAAFIRDAFELEVYDETYTEILIAMVIGFDNMRDSHKRDLNK